MKRPPDSASSLPADLRPTAKTPPEPPASEQTRVANQLRALADGVLTGRLDVAAMRRLLDEAAGMDEEGRAA